MSSEKDKVENINELQESLDDFFWSVTYRFPDGDKVHYSDSVLSITGYSSEEIQQMPGRINSLLMDDDKDIVKSVIGEMENNSEKNFAQLIYRIQTKSNKIIWLKEKVKVARNDNGQIVKLNKLAVDITEFKQKEAELNNEKEKLIRLNAEKDKFISIISHDLRSPFTTLLGFSEILINEDSLTDQEEKEYLNFIYDASKNQLQMINNLLDWSRLQTGRVKIETTRLSLKNVISNCISDLTGESVRKDIEINVDIDDKLYIAADERYIHIAVRNLINNAIKFSQKKSVIEISANPFSEGKIEIVFKDFGIGIPESEHHKLFKIDEKYAREGTNGEKGTGLGLTLVKEIIDKHEGRIWFYSREDEGSEFHIVLKEAQNIILIIEDDKTTRQLYKRRLEEYLPAYKIVESDNGYSAIKLLNSLVPAIIITDHDMPLMNGLQFIETIRNRDSTIPIIVISALFTEDLKAKYSKLGVVDLVNKPVDYKDLVRKINSSILSQ